MNETVAKIEISNKRLITGIKSSDKFKSDAESAYEKKKEHEKKVIHEEILRTALTEDSI